MPRARELKIDGYSIYIDELTQQDSTYYTDDAGTVKSNVIEWTVNELKCAMRPAINILNSLRDAAKDVRPDEMELSMQFEVCLKGETPILKIVSAESSAQIAVKFVWKEEKQTEATIESE